MKALLRLTFLLAALLGVAATSRAQGAQIEGILITASNQSGATDGRLAPYEPTLRRILRFESYHYVGSDSANLRVPGDAGLGIGDGHQLEVSTERADDRAIHVRVRWTGGGRTLMNTGLVLRPGVPAVLGGPAKGNGEVYAVLLIAR